MDDSVLTSKAIAELMRGMTGLDSKTSLEPQERKINPLGKPNKRFLGRTINNALRHNKRQIARTQLNCQQKLQELDDSHERRKRNAFFSRNNREDSYERNRVKSRSRKKSQKRHSSRDDTRGSRSLSRESRRCSKVYKKKHKKTSKDHKKGKRRRRSRSTSSKVVPPPRTNCESLVPKSEYYIHSNNLALAVAIACSQTLCASQKQTKKPPSPASTSSEIIRELMSDEEMIRQDIASDSLSIGSSSDGVHEIVTIDISSQDDQGDSSTESDTGSCIALEECYSKILKSNNESDIEIIECEPEQLRDKINRTPPTEQLKREDGCPSVKFGTTVDLTL